MVDLVASSTVSVDQGSDVSPLSLARALQRAARGVDLPVSAAAALQAAQAEIGQSGTGRPWTEIVSAVARRLSMQPHPLASAASVSRQALGCPAIGRTADGRWIVLERRRNRRWSVSLITEHDARRQTLRAAQLDALVQGTAWIRITPRLGLDTIDRSRQPGWHPWKRLRSFMHLERRELAVVAIYAVVIGGLTLATPVAVQAVVNTVAFGAVLQPLIALSLLLLVGLLFSATLRILESFAVEVLQRRLFVRVAEDFGQRIPTLRYSVRQTTDVPELVNRFFDVVTVQKAGASLLLDALSLALQMTIGLLLLAFYHPLLLAFGAVLFTALIAVVWAGRGASRTAALESQAKYATVAWLEHMAHAPRAFRGQTAMHQASHHTEMLCHDYLDTRRQHYRILLRHIAGGLGLEVLSMVALLGVGGWLVIERQLTLGQLVAAELVIGAVANGFSKLGKYLEKAYDVAIGIDKLGMVVDLPSERVGGQRSTATGPARMSAHALAIGVGGRRLLHGLDLSIEPGDRVRLEGPAGSGKTTLLHALMGAIPPTEGTLIFDELDVRRADLSDLADHVVYVGDAELVGGTVADNLSLGTAPVDDQGLRRVLTMVGLSEVIDRRPEGLDTPMTPQGGSFSTTELKRLSLARALLRRPRMLLLDGALDGLGLSEPRLSTLRAHVLGPDAPWTVVIVTDDPATIGTCNRTLDLGPSSAQGTP